MRLIGSSAGCDWTANKARLIGASAVVERETVNSTMWFDKYEKAASDLALLKKSCVHQYYAPGEVTPHHPRLSKELVGWTNGSLGLQSSSAESMAFGRPSINFFIGPSLVARFFANGDYLTLSELQSAVLSVQRSTASFNSNEGPPSQRMYGGSIVNNREDVHIINFMWQH